MNKEQADSFLAEFEATIGKSVGRPDVRSHYTQFLLTIGLDRARRALGKLEEKAGIDGFTQYNRPNLSQLKGAVRVLNERGANSNDAVSQSVHPQCRWCNRSGYVFVVYAGATVDSLKIRPRDARIIWSILTVITVPCMCPAGDQAADGERFNLSDLSRRWIMEHAAVPYRANAEEIIRQCRGITMPDTAAAFAAPPDEPVKIKGVNNERV